MAVEQDNSGRFRVYRDQHGQIYHSVTHILKNTAPQSQKDALERWSQRWQGLERDLACDFGTIAHEHCEYVLKTAAKLARQSANKKGSWKVWMMDWLDLQRRSPAGPRRRSRDHRKWRGQPVSTPEVYPTGWERDGNRYSCQRVQRQQ